MPLLGVCFEIGTKCPKCSEPMPLNRVAESVLCDACRHTVETAPGFWETILGDELTEAVSLEEGEGSTATMMLGRYGLTVGILYGRLHPRCGNDECKTAFPEAALRRGVEEGATALSCEACAREHRMRKPPDWLRPVSPLMCLLVSESGTGDRAVKVEGTEAIPFHCYSCGGSVPLDPGQRTMACPYCSTSLTVPDAIWVRMNPPNEKARWWVVLDTGEGHGVMPRETDDFCDLLAMEDGSFVGLFHAEAYGDAGHPCRIARYEENGLARWEQDGVEFSDDAKLLADPSTGHVWIFDEDRQFLRLIDSGTGEPIATLQGKAEHEGGVLDLKYSSCAWQADGTMLHLGVYGALRRFDRAGEELALWGPVDAPEKPGFFARLFRTVVELPTEPPEFDALGDRPSRLPHRALLRAGPNDRLYVLARDASFLAIFERDGSLVRLFVPGAQGVVDEVRGWGVDATGVVYVLFEHAVALRSSRYMHLGRITDRFECWVGPQATTHPDTFLGEYAYHLSVRADGSCYVAYDFAHLRRITPEGAPGWLSPGTAEHDSYQLAELKKNKRGKKTVDDRGT